MGLSKESVPTLQENTEGNEELKDFFIMIVHLGSTKTLVMVLTLAFMMKYNASSMYLWSTSFAVYFTANILQSLYAEQRLYMISSEV